MLLSQENNSSAFSLTFLNINSMKVTKQISTHQKLGQYYTSKKILLNASCKCYIDHYSYELEGSICKFSK